MAIVKVLEVTIGLALLLDLFAPIAIVAAWPITLMIAFVNSSHLSPFGIAVSIVIIALNAVMSLGHLDRYRPMLAVNAGPPSLDGLMGRSSDDCARLRTLPHALAILAGIGAAAGVTFLTIYLRH